MEWMLLLLLGWWDHRQKTKNRRGDMNDSSPAERWLRRSIPFDPGDPTTWEEYKGQDRVKEILQLILDTVDQNPRPAILLSGHKGLGKTALSRIFAKQYIDLNHELTDNKYRERFGRYIEITPAMIKTKRDLDDLMSTLQLWDVLFIDEIHMFSREIADTLLPALEDNIYPFDDGMRELPEAFVWIAATTDVGLLPEALQDRFQVLPLEPLDLPSLASIVMMQPKPVSEAAAIEIASRSAGYPRELKRIYARARDVATRAGSETVEMKHALEAFRLLSLDEHGLYPVDRQVLETLFHRPKYFAPRKDGTRPFKYAQSERTIRTITGLDENHYKQIESKLLRLGFLTIGTSGRELTPLALKTYFGVETPTH